MRIRYFIVFAMSWVVLSQIGCVTRTAQERTTWVLIKTEETKGGGHRFSFRDQGNGTKVIQEAPSGRVVKEVILSNGQTVSDLGWYEDGSRHHEIRFEDGKCVKDVSWYPNGLAEREYIYKNGLCIMSLVWYPSGQLSEKNVYDDRGGYVAAPRWYPDGQLKYEAVFKNGRVTKRTFYNEDGTIKQQDSGTE